jgi:hypothetical protein
MQPYREPEEGAGHIEGGDAGPAERLERGRRRGGYDGDRPVHPVDENGPAHLEQSQPDDAAADVVEEAQEIVGLAGPLRTRNGRPAVVLHGARHHT